MAKNRIIFTLWLLLWLATWAQGKGNMAACILIGTVVCAVMFRTLDHCWRPFDGNDYQLAKAVSNYWANFIKNGDPNGGALPVWTPYDRTSPAYMALDVQSHMQPQVTNEAVDLRVKYYCGE